MVELGYHATLDYLDEKDCMETSKDIFIQLIRSVVCNNFVVTKKDICWEEQWKLACDNHLETVIYFAAKTGLSRDSNCISRDLINIMERKYYSLVARDIQQIHCVDIIEASLKSENIHYALQKGSILRYDYPQTDMRFMSDIDFYILPEDRDQIRKSIEKAGCYFQGTESGDEQFLFMNKIGVEFHGRLLYKMTESDGLVNYPAWSYVDIKSDRLSEEGFALNLIGHAVGDLLKGGPGIRYILDLWVYVHMHKPQPDWELVFNQLQEDNICETARNLLALSEYLFSDSIDSGSLSKQDFLGVSNVLENKRDLLSEMANYVLDGGLYGSYSRNRTTEIAFAGGKRRAIKRQLFRNRKEYENRYPWLKTHPFLLPVAWILRLINSFKNNRLTIYQWRKSVKDVSNEEVKEQKERLRRWGL